MTIRVTKNLNTLRYGRRTVSKTKSATDKTNLVRGKITKRVTS